MKQEIIGVLIWFDLIFLPADSKGKWIKMEKNPNDMLEKMKKWKRKSIQTAHEKIFSLSLKSH